LVFGALRGRRIIWITLRPPEYRAVQDRDSLFGRQFGRIRDVVQGPDGHLYFATSNRDGRGTPGEGDDLILRIVPVRGSLSYLPQSQVDSP
ncbi:MAG: PQQ-dependent sugar dehydrogenase, partial [Chloroflexi bacterium]|nr:PQQ-dependent sugar dehydrogenase [Chloroflexota bacterium]